MRVLLPLLLASSAAFAQKAPGFDPSAIDRTTDPCSDFYQYACGAWMAANPIPPDQSRWGRFDALQERNREILHQILEAAASKTSQRTPAEQKMGDYYAACMDEKTIDMKGTAPLKPDLDLITNMRGKSDLAGVVAQLFRTGAFTFFRFGSSPDAKNSSRMIADLDQGGLGLPDRDYYLRTGEKDVELRNKYVEHVAKMFELLGSNAADAAKQAKAVLDVETALAKGSLSRVERRDPEKLYHILTVKDLSGLNPNFQWTKFFADINTPKFDKLNVDVPEFMKSVDSVIANSSLEDLKSYMIYHLVTGRAEVLPENFETENFNFYGKTLSGAKEQRARWKRCVDQTDAKLPDLLGRKFVDQTLGAEGVRRTKEMVAEIEKALAKDIQSLDWMTPKTKQQALIKLHAIVNKVGINEKWLTYDAVKVTRDDAYGNESRATEFEVNRDIKKIGTPVDKREWEMSQPTVNAYYDPQQNNINFPAGILQPPFYDNSMDDAVNYGAIGAVIGHELTHGFDDEGRQFDAKGNLRDWWTDADAKAFDQKASCLVNEYGNFTAVDDVKLNGKLTLGENTADNGGLRIAYMALMDKLMGQEPPKRDGFTAEQRFFLGWGQIWCENRTPEVSRLRAQTDPHSPGRYRVNGVVSNMPEFQKAFACGAGKPMTSGPACRVW